MAEVDALKLLQDDVKDEDYEGVIQAINRLVTVAVALGPQRVRGQLVPFLVEFSETDNDEAQTAVARQLGEFNDVSLPALREVLLCMAGDGWDGS